MTTVAEPSRSRLLTVSEAADELNVTERFIRKLIANGDLDALKVGIRIVRVRRSDLQALLRPARPSGRPAREGAEGLRCSARLASDQKARGVRLVASLPGRGAWSARTSSPSLGRRDDRKGRSRFTRPFSAQSGERRRDARRSDAARRRSRAGSAGRLAGSSGRRAASARGALHPCRRPR